MDESAHFSLTADTSKSVGLRDRTRQALEDAASRGDAERLKLLDDLYDELTNELERDVGKNPSS